MTFKTLLFSLLFTITLTSVFAQSNPDYYISKTINYSFDDATDRVKEALKEQDFGIITEINMVEKLKESIANVEIKPYKILGACNPEFAYQTLLVEENIGLFLPCKILVKQVDENTTEVVMVNPSVLMQMLGNEKLTKVADEVTNRFKKAMESL